MDILSQTCISYRQSVTNDTYRKQLANFRKWKNYISDIGLRDIWLQSLSQADKNFIIAGFAHQIRNNQYGKNHSKKILMAGTVEATISSISTTFREHSFKNPTLDEGNERSIFLKRQLRAFKNEDPPPEAQQCLPVSLFKSIYND